LFNSIQDLSGEKTGSGKCLRGMAGSIQRRGEPAAAGYLGLRWRDHLPELGTGYLLPAKVKKNVAIGKENGYEKRLLRVRQM
jgi:hypothetical protein